MNAAIKILIIEDSESKRNSIQSVLERELSEKIIRHTYSVREAIDHVVLERPDLIIADMSLPTYNIRDRERGGTPRPFGGIEVFETLEREEIQVPVLVVTSYPTITDGARSVGLSELSEQLKNDFPDTYIGTVYFDSAYTNWERELISFLQQVLKDKHGT